MTLETLAANFASGGAKLDTDLRNLIRELRGMKIALLAGTTATTNIAVTGAATTDTILFVLHNTAGALADLTSEASFTSAGNMQLSTTDTTGDDLLLFWYDKDNAGE